MTCIDPDVVIEPDGFDAFCQLASRLYGPLGQVTGGPLHVELKDHNTEFLTGAAAARSKRRLAAALAVIDGREGPDPGSPGAREVHGLAHAYAAEADALRTALAILEITESWSEEQAETAYAVWQRRSGRGPCDCQEWPAGFAEAP